MQRRSGLLSLTLGQDRRSVRLHRGHIVHADTNVTSDHLGEVLVRKGLLSRTDLERATAIVVSEKCRLGEALQKLGLLDDAGLEDALALHVREVLRRAFGWSEGDWAFDEQAVDAPLEGEATLKVFTGGMILEAVRSVEDAAAVHAALGDLDRVLVPSADPLLRFQQITLTPADGYVMSRIDGTLTAREVLQLIPLAAEETEKSLLGLVCTGSVEFVERPKVARGPTVEEKALQARRQEILDTWETLRGRNHFDLLGVARTATDTEIREAYLRMAKRYHPDSLDPGLADVKEELQAVFIRVGRAWEVLRAAHSRASYERTLPPPAAAPAAPAAAPVTPATGPPPDEDAPAAKPDSTAEERPADEALPRAERLLREEKPWDAIQLLEPALARLSGKPLQRARVLLARAYIRNPKWLKRGEEVLQRVVREDPGYAEAYYWLGTLYRLGGLSSRAASMFRKTAELEPAHTEALAALEELKAAAPPALLKKLFGKS